MGAALIGSALGDPAIGASNTAIGHRQVNALEEANRIQREWLSNQTNLMTQQINLNYDLAINGPVRKYESALSAGFTPSDALRLAGGTNSVSYGMIDRPIMPGRDVYAIGTTTNTLQRIYHGFDVARQGLSSGAPPAPPGFVGFLNPNFKPSPPKVYLGPRPPTFNV
uniref:VP2 n=1 Tax=Sapovirus Bari/4076/2007/ITA TaxID=1769947 RepID=A0A0U2SB41_9CALI|nr:VP2 [Sapovirus Bari/4076/2007/ITA]